MADTCILARLQGPAPTESGAYSRCSVLRIRVARAIYRAAAANSLCDWKGVFVRWLFVIICRESGQRSVRTLMPYHSRGRRYHLRLAANLATARFSTNTWLHVSVTFWAVQTIESTGFDSANSYDDSDRNRRHNTLQAVDSVDTVYISKDHLWETCLKDLAKCSIMDVTL